MEVKMTMIELWYDLKEEKEEGRLEGFPTLIKVFTPIFQGQVIALQRQDGGDFQEFKVVRVTHEVRDHPVTLLYISPL